MSLISLEGAGKDFGLRVLFADLNLHVGERERLGLIGPNGAGKSTLLRVLAGVEPLDRGQRRCSPRLKVVLLNQDPVLEADLTVIEQVRSGCAETLALLEQHQQLSQALADDPANGVLQSRLSQLHEGLEAGQGWTLERRCQEVLARVGLRDPHQRVGDLSGGNRRRVALAAALVAEPDVLLLDEPTNHLDADGVEWLQGWLDRFRGALVLVTHDRYLLDRVTRRIVAVEGGEARGYEGNYATYLARRAEEEEAQIAGAARFRGSLRRELAWLRQGPKARSTKQKARLQRIEAMREQPVRQAKAALQMGSTARRLGKRAIEAENLAIQVGDRLLLEEFSHDFGPEDRIGIIGPNGVGKSSLLDAIAGRLAPTSGRLELGSTVRLAYFDQHSAALQPVDAGRGGERKVIDVVQEEASRVEVDGVELSASQLLERFLFPPAQQHQPVARLSGGERRRLHLCRLLISAPNVLLLDEPTNDLDVATLTVLEDFLEDFQGCVVVVSHDRWFLDRTVDRLFSFDAGRLRRFEGNYSGYLEHQLASAAASQALTPSPPLAAAGAGPDLLPAAAEGRSAPALPRRRSFRETRELAAIERDLPAWEERRQLLENQMALPPGGDYGELEALSHELANLLERIASAEERWLELSELAG